MSDKPQLSSTVGFPPDGSDVFHDRRLSDLLPADFIRQIGFDPDQFIFKTSIQRKMMRRATDPGLAQFDPAPVPSRRASQFADPSYYPQNLSIQQQPSKCQWFIVELNDCQVDAYASPLINTNASDGVILRDGFYLRYGRIIKRIKAEERNKEMASLQIVSADINGSVGDFVYGISQIAQQLIPNFMIQAGAKCEFCTVETVSYQARSLLRVKVTNADDPSLIYVLHKLIHVFGTPVEVYDDLSA